MIVDDQSIVGNDARAPVNIRLLVRSDQPIIGHHKLKVHDNRPVFCHPKPNPHDNELINTHFGRVSNSIKRVASDNRLI